MRPPAHRWAPASGHRLFFPAAAVHGALAVPLWVAGFAGVLPLGWTPAVHAHEMIAGYALAVVGGFLMTRPSPPLLAASFAAWCAGRLAMLAGAPPVVAVPATLAYPVLLFAMAGLPFLRAARTGRNAVFGPVIGAFVPVEMLFWAGELGWTAEQRGTTAGLALVGLLLLGMGGRIIPAATAGALRQRGGPPVGRVQPWLERAGVAGAMVAVLAAATGAWPGAGAAGAVLAGGCALARLARWRPMAVIRQPALRGLHLGYLLLGSGWIAVGCGAWPGWPGAAASHVLGIGALGVLATAMMVRATLQREAGIAGSPAGAGVAVGLLVAATTLRLLPGWLPVLPALAAAAVCWSLAHLLVVATILGAPRRAGARLPGPGAGRSGAPPAATRRRCRAPPA